jgi:hypothetical protein
MDPVQRAILRADPRLSKFDPLPRILFFDTFTTGMSGWNILLGNYTESLDRRLPEYKLMTTPMLSNVTHWDGGTHGALDGSYALKLATRPIRLAQTVALKRLTFPKACQVQVETWFTFKPEASELKLSELDVRSIGFVLDVQDQERRVLPQVRYLNAVDGKPAHRWQYKDRAVAFSDMGEKTVSFFHYGEDNWTDIPGGEQRLCYNEIPTKINWHYVKMGWDLRTMRFTTLQCNDRVFDVAQLGGIEIKAMPNLWNLFNVILTVGTDVDKRAFAYFDSILLSGDWE